MSDASEERRAVRRTLENLASRLENARAARDGDVVLRLTGVGGGTYALSSHQRKVSVAESAEGVSGAPLVEVMGDAEVVRAIVDGEVDARERFLQGGLRLRGDLRYFSDVALELGLLKTPL
ncbi:SCP2 sterol-binding domain-containing protein [Actinomadura sp. 9N215]|uniref:SCP2 sterol-binding domain-containing protein n=1 Tax=Actinomadura sp. 9N215 TaxID=3375150 RepID=UPI0037A3E712